MSHFLFHSLTLSLCFSLSFRTAPPEALTCVFLTMAELLSVLQLSVPALLTQGRMALAFFFFFSFFFSVSHPPCITSHQDKSDLPMHAQLCIKLKRALH